MAQAHGTGFTFAKTIAEQFREFIKVRIAVFKFEGEIRKLSQSQAAELLLEHWEQHPPDYIWVRDFKSRIIRGNPNPSPTSSSSP